MAVSNSMFGRGNKIQPKWVLTPFLDFTGSQP